MNAQQKRRNVDENGDAGVDFGLVSSISNGEDLAPIVRHAFEIGKPESLVHQLKNVVIKKEAEIEDLCKLHYQDFIHAVDELRGVLVDADDLKGKLSGENHRIQDVANSLLLKLDGLLQMYSIKKNVTMAIRTLKLCIQVLSLCQTCNNHISTGHFYPALKSLNLLQRDYIHNIPVKNLKRVIEQSIPQVKLHIEKKVCSEFNDWLVHIRSTAKEIGQLAIAHATSSRQRDEEMRARQREAEEQSRLGVSHCSYSLHLDQIDDDSLVEFDLTPVYRAYHIHTFLGIEDRFRDYYYKNRMMQLNLDLQISTVQPFLESHQPFFAQIAGYFIVEDRVYRTAGGLLSDTQVEAIWESAAAKMTAILEHQFSRMDTASHLLLIKDFVTLLGSTLKRYGYRVTPLMEVLDSTRDKYHELLLAECRKQVADSLANDTYEQMVMRKEYEYNMNVVAFELQSSDIMPRFPYVAPFSSSVPDVCRVIRSFIEDSVSYLSYGGQMNLYEVVKKYLDKLLIQVLNEALIDIIHGGTLGASQAMQVAANITAFEHASDVFLCQVARLCGVPVRMVERPNAGLTAKSILRASQNGAYNSLLMLVNSKLDEFMELTTNVNWITDEPPQNGNEYMNQVIMYLDTTLTMAEQILPLETLYTVATCAMEHISDSIVNAFLSDTVKKFTVSAVNGINIDLKLLEIFADEKFNTTSLSEFKKDRSLRDCLIEARQLINLLASDNPERYLNAVIREKDYGALDYKKVATICDKFKEGAEGLFSLTNRNNKQTARKKSLDLLKKRLKEYN